MTNSGDSIAHYLVGEKLGEGGMGQVYRASDTKLHRDVALKLLPDAFTHDPERLERFRREARSLAALSHSNIGAIHGIEEADGVVALVLELVEGSTLADRIARGPLPPEEALPIARQIALALEAAHERGIVHRDLKPANVKVTPAGQVKVLDFGLAKSVERAAGHGAEISRSPTLMMSVATPGLIMGTAAYMSPEQAKGQPVDRRADVWAYGAVLFEMLSGRRLFEGNDLTEVLAAVISTEPDLSRLPRTTPDWLRDLVGRCLRRDVSMRLPDIGVARIGIAEGEASAGQGPREARVARPAWVFASLALLAGLALGSLGARWLGGEAVTPAATTFTELVFDPPPLASGTLAISPDGRRIAYTGGDDERPVMIYVRDLGDGTTGPMPGSENGFGPAFSPDGRSLAFFAGGRLWAGAIGGSLPKSVTPASGGSEGMVWMPDDTLIFSTSGYLLLQRVPASGGTAQPVPAHFPGAVSLRVASPRPTSDPERLLVSFLPDSKDASRVGVLSLVDGALTEIARGSDARYLAPSTLLFLQRDTLVAAPLDPAELTPTGAERSVELPGVNLLTAGRSTGDYAVGGTLSAGMALFPMDEPAPHALVWVDREGRETPTGFVFGEGRHLSIAANGALGTTLSPDGERVALVAGGSPTVVELGDVGRRRTLPRPGSAVAYANWEPSGERISVLGNEAGAFHGYLIDISGTSSPRQISAIPQSIPLSFFPDGESMLGYVVTPEAGRDLWVFGMDGTGVPLLQTPANERAPAVAPDGKAIAYVSDESGEDRVYVRLYPDVGRAWSISGDGATAPRWSRDGREIFFLQDARMNGVGIDVSDGVRIGTPRPLFRAAAYELDPFGIPMYDVARDGRFIMVRRGKGPRTWRFIENWGPSLDRLTAQR